jgi:hypothetical protein
MGTIRRTGGTVNLLGVMDNTAATLRLDAASGPWYVRGTIRGGRIATADGVKLYSVLGRYEHVTLAGEMELATFFNALFVDGLAMDGGSVIFKSNGSFPSNVSFNSTSPFEISGTGQFLYTVPYSNRLYFNTPRLTVGPGITFRGGGATLYNNTASTSVQFQGTVVAEVPLTGFYYAAGVNAPFINRGTLRALNGAGFRFDGPVSFDAGGVVTATPGSYIQVVTALRGTTQDPAAFQSLGDLRITAGGIPANAALIEAMSPDGGAATGTRAGANFGYGVVSLQYGFARLVDQSDNSPGPGPEAVYADAL